MNKLPALITLLIVAGCGDVVGDYGGPGCSPYDKISLKKDGTAYLTVFGNEVSAPYKADGEKISIMVQGAAGLVFTKKGDTLEAGQLLGQKVVCKKL